MRLFLPCLLARCAPDNTIHYVCICERVSKQAPVQPNPYCCMLFSCLLGSCTLLELLGHDLRSLSRLRLK